MPLPLLHTYLSPSFCSSFAFTLRREYFLLCAVPSSLTSHTWLFETLWCGPLSLSPWDFQNKNTGEGAMPSSRYPTKVSPSFIYPALQADSYHLSGSPGVNFLLAGQSVQFSLVVLTLCDRGLQPLVSVPA